MTPWAPVSSEGVRASVHRTEGPAGGALRLDFDLAGTAGYALARRVLPLELPANYEILFYIRGDAPANQFQVKLGDASGDNVWWINRPDFELPREWRLVRIKKRQIEFAWGPTTDRVLRQAATIEIGVAAGRGGGHGSVYVSGLALRELPVTAPALPPVVQASSWLPGSEASRVLDGSVVTAWRSDADAGPVQTLTVDFQTPREFGGLIVRWVAGAEATHYDVQFSDDGVQWRTVRSVDGGRGGPDAVWLPEAETRFLRLALRSGPSKAYGLTELEIRDLAFGASANAFFQALARESPRGTYPRGMSGEQPTWTLVGVDGGEDSALLSEDGALEVARGGFSIEPFVIADSRVVGWADVKAQQTLVEDYLPVPGVTWRQPAWELRVSAFATGARGRSRIVARYDLRNLTGKPLSLQLVLAVRPFQVNPPTQFLSTVGGASAIRRVAWDGTTPLGQHRPQGIPAAHAGPRRGVSLRRRSHPDPDRHTRLDRAGRGRGRIRVRLGGARLSAHAGAGRPRYRGSRRPAVGADGAAGVRGRAGEKVAGPRAVRGHRGVARATEPRGHRPSRGGPAADRGSPHRTGPRAHHPRRSEAAAGDAILRPFLDP